LEEFFQSTINNHQSSIQGHQSSVFVTKLFWFFRVEMKILDMEQGGNGALGRWGIGANAPMPQRPNAPMPQCRNHYSTTLKSDEPLFFSILEEN